MSRANFRAEEGALSTERAFNERRFDGPFNTKGKLA
jgi:hypothetical protein